MRKVSKLLVGIIFLLGLIFIWFIEPILDLQKGNAFPIVTIVLFIGIAIIYYFSTKNKE